MKKVLSVLLLLIATSGQAQTTISLTTWASGISRPIEVQNCGDDRVFVVRQAGVILVYDTAGVAIPTPFLDIQSIVYDGGNEQGLLGLAFDPDYKNNGYFYVDYTNNSSSHNTTISRFSVSATDSNIADPSSELILKVISQPYSNHNGGCVRFGPDGMLYVGMGDGGSGGDPGNRAQNKHILLGKMLRLNVHDSASNYIPSDNPYALDTTNGSPEIWDYGIRNPWRFNFDDVTGNLWIADVGQYFWEEVNFEPYGSTGNINYGWHCREGFHSYSAGAGDCNGTVGLTEPIWEYPHGTACSISGGVVYRCPDNSALWGKYLFADYCSGVIYSLLENGGPLFECDTLLDFTNNTIASFGEDKWNRVYVCGEGDSTVYRLNVTSPVCNPVAFIDHLGDTLNTCEEGTIHAYEFPGFQYSWTYNGVSVNSNSATIPVLGSGYYQLVVTQGACTGVSDSVYVNVHVVTATISGLLGTYTQNDAPITLTGTPAGGIFSGAGVTGNIFDPSAAGVGAHEIYYTYTDAAGCSAIDTVTTSIVSGINELPAFTSFAIIPNPSKGDFNIQLHGFRNEKIQFAVLDISGRVINQFQNEIKIGSNNFPVKLNLAEGAYMVQWKSSTETGVKRIIIQK